jgi:hypothetical protein
MFQLEQKKSAFNIRVPKLVKFNNEYQSQRGGKMYAPQIVNSAAK